MDTPRPELLRLPDGRLLEYACYGAATGPTAFFFHGFLGSHHQAALAHEAAARHGMRLIAPSRPHVGRSSPARRGSMADYVPDVVALADHLGIERFAAIGASGGAPYALACLAKLPRRVRVAVLVSGMGPISDPAVLARMGPMARRALQMGRRFPWLVRGLIALRVRQIRSNPEATLDQLIRRWSITDRDLFRNDGVREILLADLRQVFVDGDPTWGLAQELGLYFRWGFRFGDVDKNARVLLWHGRNDVLVPPDFSLHAAKHLPGSEVNLLPGGHFMILGHADEVLRRTREASGE